jgi:hypothetical protein
VPGTWGRKKGITAAVTLSGSSYAFLSVIKVTLFHVWMNAVTCNFTDGTILAAKPKTLT